MVQVLDDQGMVVCPCGCGHRFRVTLPSKGAGYARAMKKLSDKHIKILSVWLSHSPTCKMEKTMIFEFMRQQNLKLSPSSFNARISELKAAGLLIADQDRAKDGRNPHYSLNMDKVLPALNNGGVL